MGQLSLLDLSEPARNQTPTPTSPKRQDTTERDKASEGVPTNGDDGVTPERSGGLLTTSETAELLHVHPRTVQRLVERGELPAARLGRAIRFDARDLGDLVRDLKRDVSPSISAGPDATPHGCGRQQRSDRGGEQP